MITCLGLTKPRVSNLGFPISHVDALLLKHQDQLWLFDTHQTPQHNCDVICRNLPYGETNSVLLDQQFSYTCDDIYGWNCTGSDKMFAVYVHQRQIAKALIKRCALHLASDQGIWYLSLLKVGFCRWHHIYRQSALCKKQTAIRYNFSITASRVPD